MAYDQDVDMTVVESDDVEMVDASPPPRPRRRLLFGDDSVAASAPANGSPGLFGNPQSSAGVSYRPDIRPTNPSGFAPPRPARVSKSSAVPKTATSEKPPTTPKSGAASKPSTTAEKKRVTSGKKTAAKGKGSNEVPEAATAKAFKNMKILERILFYLPMYRIFAIQRTSKAFPKAIKESERLQRKIIAARYSFDWGIRVHEKLSKNQLEFRRDSDRDNPEPMKITYPFRIRLSDKTASWRNMFVRIYLGNFNMKSRLIMVHRPGHEHEAEWNKQAPWRPYRELVTMGQLMDDMEPSFEKYWEWRIKGNGRHLAGFDKVPDPPASKKRKSRD